ncbi:rhodanese-like domain-containing protein [Spirillospora sp. CA-142024]|uniref:rhodanese-like domain-containing protein n=1 Tax=Spirillospora sp. CA-142024 TaxID=3240036 RepID=UPI003D90444F
MTSAPAINVPTAQELLRDDSDMLVLDVRTPGEFAASHIPGALNLPLADLGAHRPHIADAGVSLLLVCQAGARAAQAHALLTGDGLETARVLAGGMNAWTAAAAPVVSAAGKPRWALERQVRLVAGGIVASSIAASLRWPRARFLAGAIGAGLTFAALTDTCTMGSALSRLPYNRGPRVDVEAVLSVLRGTDSTGGGDHEQS